MSGWQVPIKTRLMCAGMMGLSSLLMACQGEKISSPQDQDSAVPVVAEDINPDNAAEWTMGCANGQTLVVAFDHARQMVTVRRSDGLAFDLIRKTVDSGYLFSATPVELRGNGVNARWSAPPVSSTECHVTQVKERNAVAQ